MDLIIGTVFLLFAVGIIGSGYVVHRLHNGEFFAGFAAGIALGICAIATAPNVSF